MAEIKTRILLRNDQLSNWTANDSVTLMKGEIGIAMLDGNLAEVRVGDNTKWDASRKLRIEASQISGITETISATALQYCLSSTDDNEWKLLSKKLDGTGEWEEAGTLDLDQLTGFALSTDVDALVAAVSAELSTDYVGKINDLSTATTTLVGEVSAETLVSANAYTDDKIEDLSGTVDTLVAEVSAATYTSATTDANAYTDDAIADLSIDNYMLTADFNALSNEIGLSAASASNKVVTQQDIAELAGAMHFVGAVTPAEGETDAQAIAREITEPVAGDIVVITTTSKEYLYDGSSWVELGDEVLYATKAEVATISGELTSDIADITADVDYLSGQIDATNATLNTVSSDYLKAADKTALETLVGTTSAETLVSANAYADSKFAGLSDYYTKDEVDTISTALSTDYSGKIKAVDDKLADYALSADVTSLVNETSAATIDTIVGEATDLSSADTINGAKAYAKDYADEAIAGLSADNFIKHGECVQSDLSGFFILDCGGSALRTDEPTA